MVLFVAIVFHSLYNSQEEKSINRIFAGSLSKILVVVHFVNKTNKVPIKQHVFFKQNATCWICTFFKGWHHQKKINNGKCYGHTIYDHFIGLSTCFSQTVLLTEFLYQYNVAWCVLDDTKEAQDDHNDVEEVDDDRSPLVAQEVKHLPLRSSDLPEPTGIAGV